jgi:hypothetical protein
VFLRLASVGPGTNLKLVFPQGATLPDLPRMLYAHGEDARVVHGVTLTSAIESVIRVADSGGTAVVFPASIPQGVKLAGTALDRVTDKAIDLTAASVMLTWSPDGSANVQSNDFLVTLFRFDSGALTPVRTWQTTGTSLAIDTSLIAANASYVFQLVGRRGFTQLGAGENPDYSGVEYPFGWSSLFSGTFTR